MRHLFLTQDEPEAAWKNQFHLKHNSIWGTITWVGNRISNPALPTVRGTRMDRDEKPEDRQILCSVCLQVFSESLIHVIPYFNSSANAYVTTYRCEQCWIPALEATRTRLASTR